MRTKKRWLSEEKLVAEIDRMREQADNLILSGLASEKQAREVLRDKSKSAKHEDASAVLMQALKIIRSGELIRDSRLPALGRKLAELRTGTMPFLADSTIPR